MPGSHFIAAAGSVLIATGTGNAVTDRIPQSTTTASMTLRFAETDWNSDKDRVGSHLPPEGECTGNLDPDIAKHRAKGIDPLEHREIEILPHKFLECPEPAVIFPERVVRVGRVCLQRASPAGYLPGVPAARHRGPVPETLH